MKFAIVVVVALALALALAACPSRPAGPSPVNPDSECATQTQTLFKLVGELSYSSDRGRATCVPGSTKCSDAASCAVDVGDVAIGADDVIDVSISDFAGASVDISGVSMESTTHDWYVEGQPPNIVAPGASVDVRVVLRPSSVGACDGNLVVSSDASNKPRGNVALTLHANCVAGTAPGCSTSGACCCANGATSGAPICDGNGRVSCGTGFIAFDDACNEAPCTP